MVMLQKLGVKSFNKIVDLEFYKDCNTKNVFSKKYKQFLISIS